jgi:hypothetical protein
MASVEPKCRLSQMDLENAVAVAGGRIASTADLCDSISTEELEIVERWLADIQDIIDDLSEGAESARIQVVLTRSPTLALRMRPLDDGSVIILFPIGLVVRIRILATLLLSYADRDYTNRFVASIFDDRPESDWELPPRLRPIFGEFVEDDYHWQNLAELATEWVPDTELNLILRDVTWAAMAYVVMHEVGHVLGGHSDALHRIREGGLAPALSVDQQEFERALELDADDSGAGLFLLMVEVRLDQLGTSEYRAEVFHWIGFAVTLLFGMYDTRRKALGLYAEKKYPHPVIRHMLFLRSTVGYLSTEKPEWLEAWQRYEYAGWTRCVQAFWRLDEDSFVGKFGIPARQGVQYAPVTALNYNISDSFSTDDKLEREIRLLQKVVGLIARWRQG